MSSGLRVFLVEDDVMIRMMMADMVEELGHSVAAEAGALGQALQLAQSIEFDLAILDVNLYGQIVSPVAELIQERGLPFIFATGYGEAGLPDEFRGRPTLAKPFKLEALSAAIDAIKS